MGISENLTGFSFDPLFSMIIVEPNINQIHISKDWYNFNALNNSITEGAGNRYGALGEIIVGDYFAPKHKIEYSHGNLNYDWKFDDKIRVEVKTKKVTSWPPHGGWTATVAETSRHQICDYYFFVFIKADFSLACLAGFQAHDQFYSKSFYGKKGEIDTTKKSGWRFTANCYNLHCRELHPFKPIPQKPYQLCLHF